MDKSKLKKDEVILGQIKQKPYRMIGWIVISLVVIALALLYFILSFNSSETLYNILFIIVISLITLLLCYKCFISIKKYQTNFYVLTNQRIYIHEFFKFKCVDRDLAFDFILDIKIFYNELFRINDIEIYSKKRNVTFNDNNNRDVSIVLESLSREDVDFIMKVINKYRKK